MGVRAPLLSPGGPRLRSYTEEGVGQEPWESSICAEGLRGSWQNLHPNTPTSSPRTRPALLQARRRFRGDPVGSARWRPRKGRPTPRPLPCPQRQDPPLPSAHTEGTGGPLLAASSRATVFLFSSHLIFLFAYYKLRNILESDYGL